MVGSRRQARELALQVMFQKEFASDIPLSEFVNLFYKSTEIKKESVTYAHGLLVGFDKVKASVDPMIQATSSHWSLERMSPVDRNVMRIAVYEMLFAEEKLDGKIVINEAVELARKYGTTDSSQFVNGILDQILKQNR